MPEVRLKERVVTGILDRRGARALGPICWVRAAREDLARLRESRFVLGNLVSSALKTRYQRSALGFLWTLLHPALILAVLAIVFSQVIGRSVERFPVYLFSGLIPYQFLSDALTNGGRSLVIHEGLAKRVPVQTLAFPLSAVLVALANMLFAMTAMFLVLQFLGARFTVQLVLLPVAILLMGLFTLGATLIAMTLVTYCRDFEHILSVLLRALWFGSPILFQPHQLGKYEVVMAFNPLTYFLQLFRCALYDATWPDRTTLLVSVASAGAMFAFGYAVYKRHERDYIFRL